MRRKFEVDGVDGCGILTIGETRTGENITLTLTDTEQQSVEVTFDAFGFKEICNLQYKIDFPTPKQEALRLPHTA